VDTGQGQMDINAKKSIVQHRPERYKSPLYVLWDLTYKCNHKCIFCYNNCRHQSVSLLTAQQLDNIANQIVENEVISVTFGGGEPLLETPSVFRLGHIMKDRVWLVLATNGSLITPELARPLAKTFSAIQISLHGFENGFDELVGVPGAFKGIINGIEILGDAGFNRIEICFVLTRQNHQAFEPLVDRMVQLGNVPRIRVQCLIPSGMAYYNQDHLSLTPDEVKMILKRYRNFIEGNGKIAFIFDDVVDELIDFRDGTAPNPFLHIYPDGRVGIFPHIPVVLGNLVDESLQSIWEQKGADFFRFPQIKDMLNQVKTSDDIGYYSLIDNRPWIDAPIHI